MRLPNGEIIYHAEHAPYDPAKAHAYYLRTRKLKGRKKAVFVPPSTEMGKPKPPDPAVRAQKKKELAARIDILEKKVAKLNSLIKQKEADSRKSAKEAAKPDTAAEKSEKARESKKYRDKHKQEIAAKAKAADEKSGGTGSGTSTSKEKTEKSLKDLKMLATRVRGQLAAAKAKLSAL